MTNQNILKNDLSITNFDDDKHECNSIISKIEYEDHKIVCESLLRSKGRNIIKARTIKPLINWFYNKN